MGGGGGGREGEGVGEGLARVSFYTKNPNLKKKLERWGGWGGWGGEGRAGEIGARVSKIFT